MTAETSARPQIYSHHLLKVCEVVGVIVIAGNNHGAMVRLASSGALVEDTGGKVKMLHQNWMRLKLLLVRQQQEMALELVKVAS